ncbi:MAG: ABC transporter ATP-binding protein [Bacteroidales bacterium]|nr:ABC transporter ATP-binding protein [Bacteroidales bacterium]
MDKNTAIEFQNVGKQYRLGRVGTGTLQHDLNRWWQMAILRKEDPYLQVGEVNDRSKKGNSEYVWALKDISFKVEKGDVVGIIGKNGAGKSTLLKLLSHITAPTTGKIDYRGRIASLLEVGTGFHPEMTGRENIYMNGSIMGMTRHEITRKLDEIVDFAGVERYIDTPVKRYSSGMTVRLGFAVAAFLEPEILVVDEVLTVGDAEFQKKAIGKMDAVAKTGGRTVLFVSHNMAAVRNLCNHGIVLSNGQLQYSGAIDDCVDYYLNASRIDIIRQTLIRSEHHYPGFPRNIEFVEVEILGDANEMATDEPIDLLLTMRRNDHRNKSCQYTFYVNEGTTEQRIVQYISKPVPVPEDKDLFQVRLSIRDHGLTKGIYSISLEVGTKDIAFAVKNYDHVMNVLSFNIQYLHRNPKIEYAAWNRRWGGFFLNEGSKMECEVI